MTFYIRTGAWYAYHEDIYSSLFSPAQDSKDRNFAVNQIEKVRGNNQYGDMSVRPRITPKINLSATSLVKLIQWNPGQVVEPAFTCLLSTQEIQQFSDVPYNAPKFSCNTQATERCVKIAAALARPEAREAWEGISYAMII